MTSDPETKNLHTYSSLKFPFRATFLIMQNPEHPAAVQLPSQACHSQPLPPFFELSCLSRLSHTLLDGCAREFWYVSSNLLVCWAKNLAGVTGMFAIMSPKLREFLKVHSCCFGFRRILGLEKLALSFSFFLALSVSMSRLWALVLSKGRPVYSEFSLSWSHIRYLSRLSYRRRTKIVFRANVKQAYQSTFHLTNWGFLRFV